MVELLLQKVAAELKYRTFKLNKERFDPQEPEQPGHRPPDNDYEARKIVQKRFG